MTDIQPQQQQISDKRPQISEPTAAPLVFGFSGTGCGAV